MKTSASSDEGHRYEAQSYVGRGSAGNTVVAVNQFGGKSFYSCLVSNDELGKFFLEDLKRNGVETNLKYEQCPDGITGKCLVMTSPDAERTMNTFLGVSSFPFTWTPWWRRDQKLSICLPGGLSRSQSGRVWRQSSRQRRLPRRTECTLRFTFSDASMVKYFSKQMEEIVGAGWICFSVTKRRQWFSPARIQWRKHAKRWKKVAKRFAITLVRTARWFMMATPSFRSSLTSKSDRHEWRWRHVCGCFMFGITHGHIMRRGRKAGFPGIFADSLTVRPRMEKAQAKRF